jgi:hypothetical protein
LPLPADLQRELDAMRLVFERERQRAGDLEKRMERQERELAELRTLVAQHLPRRNNGSKTKS